MIKKLWKDPVWSKVIASGIIFVFGLLSIYILDLWVSIKDITVSSISFIGSSSEVSNWIIGVMGLCTVLIILIVITLLWERVTEKNETVNWKNYLTDNFIGLEWHWRYDDVGSIYNLYCCCDNCHYQVFPQTASGFAAVPRFTFKCDSCGRKTKDFDGSYEELESKVERFIQQKIRTRSWPTDKNMQ